MPSNLNWCYGASGPTLNADLAHEQILLAHRYKNKLRELEHKRRKEADACVRAISPEFSAIMDELDAANARVDAAFEAVNKMRAKARKRLDKTPEQEAEITAAKKHRKEVAERKREITGKTYTKLRELQEPYKDIATSNINRQILESDDPKPWSATKKTIAIKQEYLRMLNDIDLDAGEYEFDRDFKQARADSGCYWGTYLVVEDAAKDFRKGKPPKFRRYTGEGSIAVQLQQGVPIAEIFACTDTRLQIDREKSIVRIRVGSNGRKPIWAEFPIVIHREVPEDAIVKWAFMDTVMRGDHRKWKLRLSIVTNKSVHPNGPGGKSIVTVHLGHRMLGDSLRVATWEGSDGDRGQIIFDEKTLSSFTKSDSLESIRDAQANVVQDAMCRWLNTCRDSSDPTLQLPDWMKEETSHIALWNGPERMSRLLVRWRDNRFASDSQTPPEYFEELLQWARDQMKKDVVKRQRHPVDINTVFGVFELWRRWDKHLREWSVNQSRDVSVARDQYYRELTKQFKTDYAKVAIADVNWAKLAEKEKEDEDVVLTSPMRRLARVASPGRFQALFVERFGSDVIWINSKEINKCHACGSKEKWDKANLMHTCSKCGAIWDQDVNAVKTTLAIALNPLPNQIVIKEKKKPKKRANRRRSQQSDQQS